MKKGLAIITLVALSAAGLYPLLAATQTLPAGLAMAALSNDEWQRAIAECVLEVNQNLMPGEIIADRPRVSIPNIMEARVIVPVEDIKKTSRRDALCKYRPQSYASR